MDRKPDPVGPLVLETLTLTVLAAWRWRLELLILSILSAGGWAIRSRSDATTGAITVLFIVGAVHVIPPVRRFLWRLLRAQHVKRQWTQAVIDSGAADPPPKRSRRKHSLTGPRATRVRQVKTGDLLTVKIGRGNSVDELEARAEPLAACLSGRWTPVREVRITRDRAHADRATALLVRRDPFEDATPVPWALINVPQTSVWDTMPFGFYDDGDEAEIDGMDGHILIGGVTGSGKSVAMHTLIAYAALDPTCRVVLLDNKRAEFAPWEPIADAFIGPSMRDAVRTLKSIQQVMEDRFREQAGGRVRKVVRGDETYCVFIDELAFYLLNEEKEQAAQFYGALLDLLQRGRSAGIRIRAATQRPSAEILNTNLRAQFGTRIAFRVMEAETTQMILGSRAAAAHDIPDKGYAGVGYMGGESTRPRRFRAPFLSEQDVDNIVARAERIRTDRDLAALLPHTPSTPKIKAAELRSASTRGALLDVLPATGEGLTRSEIREATKRPDQETFPVLKELVLLGGVVRDGGGRKGDPYRYRVVRDNGAQFQRTVRKATGEEPESAG